MYAIRSYYGGQFRTHRAGEGESYSCLDGTLETIHQGPEAFGGQGGSGLTTAGEREQEQEQDPECSYR